MTGTQVPQRVKILRATPLKHKVIQLELSTGSVLKLNMENRLNTVRFSPLKDEAVFRSITTDGFYLHFDVTPNYELDFTLREAVMMALNPPPGITGFFPDAEEGNQEKEETR